MFAATHLSAVLSTAINISIIQMLIADESLRTEELQRTSASTNPFQINLYRLANEAESIARGQGLQQAA